MSDLDRAKTSLRTFLYANGFTPTQVKEASKLVAGLCAAAVREEKSKRPDPIAKLADVFFNRRRA